MRAADEALANCGDSGGLTIVDNMIGALSPQSHLFPADRHLARRRPPKPFVKRSALPGRMKDRIANAEFACPPVERKRNPVSATRIGFDGYRCSDTHPTAPRNDGAKGTRGGPSARNNRPAPTPVNPLLTIHPARIAE
jgi:hypothetical protein